MVRTVGKFFIFLVLSAIFYGICRYFLLGEDPIISSQYWLGFLVGSFNFFVIGLMFDGDFK